ncbi:unnamed protein product [Paramecium pentaurelia]|uniref:Uncharacterized protein n=1 Tax=Paramecium pentaurelia TaxID=43138 RepID=A0A8S1VU05_9CILI|nr:unnamed protein product [Paramecium pentaurelia]
MLPFTQFPQFFQYSQTYNYPYSYMEQFNQFQQYFYINNYLFQNNQQAQSTNLLFEGYKQPTSIIKQENSVIQEQCLIQQSNFEPVEIVKNLENIKSPILLKKRPKLQLSNNKGKGNKSTKRKLYNIGHWTTKEHNLYLSFREKNKEIMLDSDLKKQNKIFKQMSNFIKTRQPSQCRSHHQKFGPNNSTSNNTSNFIECQNFGNHE